MQPKLSICIPTYNRSSYLKILLNSIVGQIEGYQNIIELIVSDNASTDDTSMIVDEFIQQGVIMRYIKKPTNTGLDGNIANCFINASGEYVWIIGDDDILVDGAISYILGIITHNEYGLIYVRSIGYDQIPPSVKFRAQKNSCIECNRLKFTRLVGIMFTFVSGSIINKKRYLQYRDYSELEKFYGTNLILLSWTYFLLNVSNRFMYVNSAAIISKANNTGGYKLFETFSINQSMLANVELNKFPKLIKIIEQDTMLAFFPGFIRRAYGNELESFLIEKDAVNILYPVYKKYISFWLFVYPLKLFRSSVKSMRFISMIAKVWLYTIVNPRKLHLHFLNLLRQK